MKIPLFNTPIEKMVISKGMLAGFGLLILGGYIMSTGSQEFGFAIILNGLGLLGIRDKL